MFAILAIIAFLLYTFGVSIPEVNMLGIGLVFLSVHLLWPWSPIAVRRDNT